MHNKNSECLLEASAIAAGILTKSAKVHWPVSMNQVAELMMSRVSRAQRDQENLFAHSMAVLEVWRFN